MNDILHGAWLPSLKRFFLWGETPDAPRRKGRQAKLPPHPFQSAPEALRQRVEQLGLADALDEHALTLWLPSADKTPFPSPELLETGALTPPQAVPQLAPWKVTGLLLPPTAALDLLLALSSAWRAAESRARATGADVQAWRGAALLAMEMVAGQQVMPVLLREGFQLRAAWRPRPSPAVAQKLVVLARSLPPLCRAAVDDPSGAPAPRALLDDFIAATVDATIRQAATGLAAQGAAPSIPANTPGGKWLAALTGAESLVDLKGPEADALFKAWQTWAGQAQVAGDDVFRLTFRLEPPGLETDPWELAYLLQATDDPSLLVPAASIWREKGSTFTYLNRRFEQPQERLLTGLGYASRLFPPIEASLRHTAPDRARLSASEAFTFLKEAAPLLENSGYGVLVPAWWQSKGARLRAKAKVKGQTHEKGILSFAALVDFHWEITLGGEPIDRAEFERLAALKLPLVQVRGQWVVLDPEQLQNALKFFQQRDGEMAMADALRAALGGEGQAVPEGVEFDGVDAEGWLRDLLDRLADAQSLETALLQRAMPDGLRGKLRPYQVRGYSWLTFLRQFGLGACLADDMGLGKTIQTIALLLHERERLGVRAPALLVCPTSVVGNWLREIERFAPTLRVMIHRGIERRQGKAFVKAIKKYDAVLTSYPLLARDRETLGSVEWSTLVLDEAQNIKNASTKQAQAARAIPAANRIALTGTPVENRLSELWSIMTFLNPGYLGSEASFRREFARPIERTGDPLATERLRKLTTPFVLRRLKTDPTIISDLPEKLEMKVYCPLTKEQATLYQAVVRDVLEQVEKAEDEGDTMQRRGLVLAMLLKLKQVCNHPAQFLKDGSELPGRSGKLARLMEMLEEVYAGNDRALVFTQFAEMGKLLQGYLRNTFYDDILFLHGDTPAQDRDGLVRRFHAPNGPRVFILSLKAGGTGLNLTAANHVFHFDRWWNPAVENQATDRAFRIGQTRNVQVHKFICGGTLEDHIDEMIESKRALAESVLGASEGWLTELSTDQLRDLVTLRREDIAEE